MEPTLEKFWKSLRKDLRNRKALRNATKFMVIFILLFALSLLVLIPLLSPLWDFLGVFNSHTSHAVLALLGVESSVSGNVITTRVGGQDVGFEISQICSGDIEIALLASLILASFDIAIFWRLLGSLAGALLVLLVNPLRISLTILITARSDLDVGELAHNIIFRLFLFLLLVFYYLLWYNWTKGMKNPRLEYGLRHLFKG
ncbi:MAG: archaeosortase/exosortase family protein [Candidatus Altiarchaeota archaeon]|nr:archaeosortase/exosortase family protein [Candidatus Altiarchaeota archaeon]